MQLMEERLQWGNEATFTDNKRLPVYNWFYYKEGFSRSIVFRALKMAGNATHVLDPFCGVGTTLLASKEHGINSTGIDVSELAVFVSNTKITEWDTERLREILNDLKKQKFRRVETKAPAYVRRFFNKYAMEDVMFLREAINSIQGKERDFFMLALLNTVTKCSYMYKDGSIVKVVKKPLPPLRKYFYVRARSMIKDVEKSRQMFKHTDTHAFMGDARYMKFDNESFDLIITSPPYLNKIEYTNIYGVEDFILFGERKENRGKGSVKGVRGYIGYDIKKHYSIFPDIEMPDIARAYFYDMKFAIDEMYRVLKDNSHAFIVVGNGCMPDSVIESDIILSEIAKKAGFDVKKIYVLAKRKCMRNRSEHIGELRESMLVLEK